MKAPKTYYVSTTSNTHCFCTNALVLYTVVFSEFELTDYHQNKVPAWLLNISREPPAIRGEGSNHRDSLVGPTIQAIIIRFLKERSTDALCYICDAAGGLASGRHRLFQRWFRQGQTKMVKYDSKPYHQQQDIYASIVMHTSHPNRLYVMDAFYKTLDYHYPEEVLYPIPDEDWQLGRFSTAPVTPTLISK